MKDVQKTEPNFIVTAVLVYTLIRYFNLGILGILIVQRWSLKDLVTVCIGNVHHLAKKSCHHSGVM
jgi:hypothetical protein